MTSTKQESTHHLGNDRDVGAKRIKVDSACLEPIIIDVTFREDASQER